MFIERMQFPFEFTTTTTLYKHTLVYTKPDKIQRFFDSCHVVKKLIRQAGGQ